MTAGGLAPVRKEIVVEASQERAFRLFTDGFDKWWPRTHSIQPAPLARVVLEPRAGGRWYEVGTDGSECDWGKVLLWEPPRRVVLAWQISSEWRYDPSLVTEVEVRFTVVAARQTRVELEHRNLERFGEGAGATRASLESDRGWGGLLALYSEEASKEREHA